MGDIEQPIPAKIPLHVFALGMAWAIISAMAPLGILIYDWVTRWSDPPDPTMLIHVGLVCAAGGAIAYWRKYKALLQLPPELELARQLASQVKTVTTTETVEHLTHPTATVTTTVEETKTEAVK
jgi:hypothetical protein